MHLGDELLSVQLRHLARLEAVTAPPCSGDGRLVSHGYPALLVVHALNAPVLECVVLVMYRHVLYCTVRYCCIVPYCCITSRTPFYTSYKRRVISYHTAVRYVARLLACSSQSPHGSLHTKILVAVIDIRSPSPSRPTTQTNGPLLQ